MSNIFDIKSNNSIKQKIVKMLLQEKYIDNLPKKISKIYFMLLDKKNRPFYNPFKEIFKDKYNDLKNEIDKIIDSEDSPFLKGKKIIELIKTNNLYSIDNLEHINNIQKMFYLTSNIYNNYEKNHSSYNIYNKRRKINTREESSISELYANVFKDLYDSTYNILSKYIDYNTFINYKDDFYNLFVKYASLDMNNTLSFELNAIIRKIEKKCNIKIDKDDVKTLKNNIENLYEKNQFITEKIIQNKIKYSLNSNNQYNKLFTKLPIYLRMGVSSYNNKLDMVHNLTNYSTDEISRFNIELFLYDSGLIDDISDKTKKYLSRMLSFAKLMKNPKFLKYIYYYGLDEIDTIISLSKKLNIKEDKRFEIEVKKRLLPKIYKFIENNETKDSLISSKYYTKYFNKTFDLNKYFNFLIEDIQKKSNKENVPTNSFISIEEPPIINNYILESVDNENVGTYVSYRLNEIIGKDNIVNLINNEIVDFDSVYDKLSVFISFIDKNTKKFSSNQKDKEKIKIINILNRLKKYIENDRKFINKSNNIEKQVEDLIKKSINMDFYNIANSVNSIIDSYNKEYVNILNNIEDTNEREKFIKIKIGKILNILDNIEDTNEYIELLKDAISSDNLDDVEKKLKNIFNKLNISYNSKFDILSNIDTIILELKDRDSNLLNMNKLIDIHFMLNSEHYIPKIDLSLSEKELNSIDDDYYKVINSIYDNIEDISDKHQFLKDISLYIKDIYFSKLFNKLTENSESISLNEREYIENYLKDNFDFNIDKKSYNRDLLNMLNSLTSKNKRLQYLKNLFKDRKLDENYPKDKDFIEKLNNKTELYKNSKNYISLFVSKMVNDYIHNINKKHIKKREVRLRNSIESLYNDFKLTSGLYKIKEPYLNILKILKSEIKYGIIDLKHKEDLTKLYEKVAYSHINSSESFIFRNVLNRFYKYYENVKDFSKFINKLRENNNLFINYSINIYDDYKKISDIIKLKNILDRENLNSKYFSDMFDPNKLENTSDIYDSIKLDLKIGHFNRSYTKNSFFILDKRSNELSILKKRINNSPFTCKYLINGVTTLNRYSFSRNWDNLQFLDNIKFFKLSFKKFTEDKVYREKNIVKLSKLSSNKRIREVLYNKISILKKENKDKLIDILDNSKEFTEILNQLKDKKDDSLFLINIHNNLYNRTDIVIDNRLKDSNSLVDFFNIDKNNIDYIKNIYIYNKILNKPFKIYSKDEIKNNLQNIVKDLIKDDVNFYIDIIKENNYLLNKVSYIKKELEEKKKAIIEHIDKKVIEEKYENRSNLSIIEYNLLKDIKKTSDNVFSNKDKYIPTFSKFEEGSKFIYFIDKDKNIDIKYIDQKYGLTKVYGKDGLEKVYDIDEYNNIFEYSRDNSLYNSLHDLKESLEVDNIVTKSRVDYLKTKLNSEIREIKEVIDKIVSIDQQEKILSSKEQDIKK